MPEYAKILRADTSTPVNLLNAEGKPYIEDIPPNANESARKNGQWVNISEELKMARWFAETDRVITNTTIPAVGGNLPATVRRVRVGNIYLYRLYVEGLDSNQVTIVANDYVVGSPADYPELVGYEFSVQMAVPVFTRTPAGAMTISGQAAGLVQPDGIILHIPIDLTLQAGHALIFEATRSQMGPWA